MVSRAHPKMARLIWCAPQVTQPIRQTNMVRVHMGHNYAQDWQAFKMVVEYLLPMLLGSITGNAAIYNGPTIDYARWPYTLIT
jgi:hypothetical protein